MKKREKMVKKPKKYPNYTQSYSNVFVISNPYPNYMIRGGLLVLYTVSHEFIIKKTPKIDKNCLKFVFLAWLGGFLQPIEFWSVSYFIS